MLRPVDDYTAHDASGLAERVARSEVSPAELVDTAIDAIERVNPSLNAVVHRMYESARAQARGPLPQGPLRGVPMVIKDYDGFLAGEPYTGSCRYLEGYVPERESEALSRLRRAGVIFLAKTNCPELGLMGTTEPALRGPTRNPYRLERSTGGSSGGSAALVAARAVPLGHGGDGGGSLRIPASHCGLIALKPTRGRVPVGPHAGEGWGGYVQWGALTRSVRDTAAVLDIMAGPMPGDPYAAPALARPLVSELRQDPGALRVGFFTGSLFGSAIDPEHSLAVKRAATQLAQLGHRVEEAVPAIDKRALVRAYLVQIAVGVATRLHAFARELGRAPRPDQLEPATWFLAQVGRTLSAVELTRARDIIQAAGRVTAAFHARYDLFLCATTAHPPVHIGALKLSAAQLAGLSVMRRVPVSGLLRTVMARLAPGMLEHTPNTQLFNQTGQPAISLPLHVSAEGLPVGVQLAAAMGREDTLIRVAAQLEAAKLFCTPLPRLSA